MSKEQSSFLNMALSLVVITLVAGLSLGFINDLTLEPKAKAKLLKKTNALKTVLPVFDNNLVAEAYKIKTANVKDSIELYPAFKQNELVGVAITGSSEKALVV